MFRFWFFGVIISTTTISLNVVTGADECAEKCDALGPISTVQFLPHSSKKIYCICSPATNSKLGKCNSHETWSNDLKKCIPDDDITKGCQINCPKNCVTLRAHRECSKYCYCNQGKAIIKECPRDFHFSKKEMLCLPQDEARCTTPGIIRSGSTASTIECDGKCPPFDPLHHTIHLPHKNCQKFCKCNSGIPVIMDCPDRLHFNRILQVCDWPSKANCTRNS